MENVVFITAIKVLLMFPVYLRDIVSFHEASKTFLNLLADDLNVDNTCIF